MIDTSGIELVQKVLDDVRRMADDTHDFIWAVRRSLIVQSVIVAIFGMATMLNFWLLHRVMRVMHEVLRLVQALIDERAR